MITIDTFKNKIKNKDTFIVYVGRPTCSDCELLDDRLISNIEEDSSLKKILYMNITIIHENKSKWNDFKSTYNIKGTPAFISIKNGEIKSNYSWTKENGFDFEVFMEWIKKEKQDCLYES